MRQLRLLFLALLFILSTSASAAASVHSCCPDQVCDLAQCIDIGCAAALPGMAFDTPMALAPISPRAMYEAPPGPRPPRLVDEIWTPPD